VLLVQMKNWLPFVFGPELAMLRTCTFTHASQLPAERDCCMPA